MASGKRVAARPPSSRARSPRAGFWLLVAGVAASLLTWGILVYAAIGFGAHGRAGDGWAWLYLALSSLGAVACLFAALLLIARLLTAVEQPDPAAEIGLLPPATTPPPAARLSDDEPVARPDLEPRPSSTYADELRRRIAALEMADDFGAPPQRSRPAPATGPFPTRALATPAAPTYGPEPRPEVAPPVAPPTDAGPGDEPLPPGARPSGYRRRLEP